MVDPTQVSALSAGIVTDVVLRRVTFVVVGRAIGTYQILGTVPAVEAAFTRICTALGYPPTRFPEPSECKGLVLDVVRAMIAEGLIAAVQVADVS